MDKTPKSSKLWGGRFSAEIDDLALAYSESTAADAVMVAEDIWGSEAHAIMLAATGIIAETDLRQILYWLEKTREDFETGRFQLRPELEDVHLNVEWNLREHAGSELAGRLHTARSRNDQVVTDCRMHLRVRLLEVIEGVADLQEVLVSRARDHVEDVMPGYTHTQHAQPVSVGFWLSGHAAGLARDVERLQQAYARTNLCPLGGCALAGTSFPTNRRLTARLLGFDGLVEHALDAVQSRDFLLEALAALAILAANLSRMAEEIVLWSTYEFGMIELDDALASGSSIMPQKKNPCMAELARARTGRLYGRLMQALVMAKALPGGYNRDLQEDKPPLWEALDCACQTLAILAAMYRTMTFKTGRMTDLVEANFATATELANWLVRERGLPFRQAHEIVGGVVGTLVHEGKTFTDLDRVRTLLAEAGQEASVEALAELLDPRACMMRQGSEGGTGPMQVRRQVELLAAGAAAAREWVAERRAALRQARELTDRIIRHVLAGQPLSAAGLSEV
ncbi:MAG: argininosuccinate lyase [Armatimonadetes bacterium]|nr:argininosuccinate lyase [Armatimonadota bacterium]